MRQIIFCKGLPGSGKSTFSKKWIDEDPVHRVRINKDDLRNTFHQSKYSKGNERQILHLEEIILLDALQRDKSVILDNTHLAINNLGKNVHYERLLKLLIDNDYCIDKRYSTYSNYIELKIQDFTNMSPEECIINDLKRKNSVGQNIIWEMYWKYVAIIQTNVTSNLKKDCIIVDVDGTLATMCNRSPFDWSKVSNDKIKSHIRTMVNVYKDSGYKIIIVSGRDESCKEATIDWLINHDVNFDEIYTRSLNDNRKDFIIKKEIYNKYIEPNYNVHLVLDDRPQVIREWRRLGLNVINVNPIDKEF